MSQTSPSHIAEAPVGAVGPAAEYDEMVSGAGSIRPEWRPLIGALHAMPDGAFADRVERVWRLYEDVAIAYSIESEPHAAERRPFDPLPMLLGAEEWPRIEAALQQRARLLSAVLADLYGPRRLLAEGRLPPALVYGNPRFLRPCSGIAGPDGSYVHSYAADLVRLPDGSWRVCADRLQAPAGVGFALRNRTILARTMPELFRAHAVERIEPFFEFWQASLAALAPERDRPARIVVMTPGPFNPAFFEHVYLARQLGAALVEGADLTMRDSHVYIKTLGVLQPVDVILRFMEDDYADPLELRGDSVLGVAGLLRAVRAGNVVVVNALGASLAETPALRPFLPSLADHLLGERLAMPSIATEWLGDPAALESLPSRLGDVIVRPAFATRREEQSFAEEQERIGRRALIEEVRRRPHLYVAEERVRQSVMPVWSPEGLVPRPLTLRVFLIRSGGDYVAMPGGFTQVPHHWSGTVAPLNQVGMSKDTWVLAGEVEAADNALQTRPRLPASPRLTDELRSRTADDLYWLGRYTERLDNAARIMRSAVLRLTGERLGPGQQQEIQYLVRLLIESRLAAAGALEILPDTKGLLLTLSTACVAKGALHETFRAVHRITQSLRDRLSNDMWKVVFGMLREARERLERGAHDVDRAIAAFDYLVGVIAAFGGMASENMTRGSGWRFLDIGRRLERAVYGTSVLKEVAGAGGRDSEGTLGLVLELCDSSITYRRRYLGTIQAGAVFEQVLADDANPRGVAFQLHGIARHLKELGTSFERPDEQPAQTETEWLLRAIRNAPIGALDGPSDHAARLFLDEVLGQARVRLLTLSDTITRAYFSHTRLPHAIGYPWARS